MKTPTPGSKILLATPGSSKQPAWVYVYIDGEGVARRGRFGRAGAVAFCAEHGLTLPTK